MNMNDIYIYRQKKLLDERLHIILYIHTIASESISISQNYIIDLWLVK